MSTLTEREHHAVALLGELAGVMREIIGDGDQAEHDWAETAAEIHHLQFRVLAQAAGRAYPDRYRLLGGWPEGHRARSPVEAGQYPPHR